MTELLLNLLWLLIAAGVVTSWCVHWAQRPQGRRPTFREWTALACSLVLLFFAVSLSDDLHEEVILSDVSFGSGKQLSCCAAGARLSPAQLEKHTTDLGWAILPPPQPPAFFVASPWISVAANVAPAVVSWDSLSSRSPPLFTL